jgi:hypothetical protein
MEIRQKEPEAIGRSKPLPYCDFWSRSSKLLLSSVNRGWRGLSAELRSHSQSFFPWRGPQTDTHIIVDIIGSESLVTRRATGIVDRYVSPISSNGWIPTTQVLADGCQAISSDFGLNLQVADVPTSIASNK